MQPYTRTEIDPQFIQNQLSVPLILYWHCKTTLGHLSLDLLKKENEPPSSKVIQSIVFLSAFASKKSLQVTINYNQYLTITILITRVMIFKIFFAALFLIRQCKVAIQSFKNHFLIFLLLYFRSKIISSFLLYFIIYRILSMLCESILQVLM